MKPSDAAIPREARAWASPGPPEAQPAVEMQRVGFTYDGTSVPALNGINLTISPGEMIGIMGASGAGKSTLAKCLNRLVPAFEAGDFHGIVRIGGRPLDGTRVSDVASIVGMVFQDFEAQLFSTNVALEVAFTLQQIGMSRDEIAARVAPALTAVGLTGFEHRDPTSLSGGEKQRLAIAAILALRPRVIVLDEPTTDLDPEGKAEVFALIGKLREQGLSLVVIEHEADELRTCDRILLLRDGEVVTQGTPAAVMTQLDLLETCGVHPPDLNRALTMLGIRAHAASVDEAESLIRSALSLAPPKLNAVEVLADNNQQGRSMVEAFQPVTRSDRVLSPVPFSFTGEDKGGGTAVSQRISEGGNATPSPLVEINGLVFSYPHGARALEGINLRILPGEFVAIVGQNGSGKTTLAKHMVGLLRPDHGQILLDGRDRNTMRPAETAHLAGYVFQNPDHQIFASTVEGEVAFGPDNFGLGPAEVERRVDEVLRAVHLENARTRDPFLLSKGERQRLAVASVLALRPRLLILDEPTTGLDYREQRRMMRLVLDLNRAGIAITIITHTPWLVAEYARRVILMSRARILFDGPVLDFFRRDELLAQSSFRQPEVTLLARRFGIAALSPESFVSALRPLADTAQPC